MKRVKTHWNGNMENHADKHKLKQQIEQSNSDANDLLYYDEMRQPIWLSLFFISVRERSRWRVKNCQLCLSV
jgi:hypothetical protein